MHDCQFEATQDSERSSIHFQITFPITGFSDSWETPVQLLGWEDPLRDRLPMPVFLGFPCGSAGKESDCMMETWVQFLDWEDLEKGKGYPLQYPGLENSRRISWRIPCIVYSVTKSRTQLSNFHFQQALPCGLL